MTESNPSLANSARAVQDALHALGFSLEVKEMPATTRTAVEAAAAIGCEVAQIVKSLVFETAHSHKPILILASGSNRVNEKAITALVGEPVRKPDADFVRQQTGFAIGGIPPVGHIQPLTAIIDADLLLYSELWAAAGTPYAVFRLTPADLQRMTGGQVAAIKAG